MMGRSSKNHVDDDFDDFDSDFTEALNFNDDQYDLDAPVNVGKGRNKGRKKKKAAAVLKLCSAPQNWDDDWIDPADDLMYGFDDSDHRWRAY